MKDLFRVQFDRWLPRCLELAQVVQTAPPGDWHKPLYFRVNKPVIIVNRKVTYYDAPNLWTAAASQLAASIRAHFGHFFSDIEIRDNVDYLEAMVTLGRLYQPVGLPEPEDDNDDWW